MGLFILLSVDTDISPAADGVDFELQRQSSRRDLRRNMDTDSNDQHFNPNGGNAYFYLADLTTGQYTFFGNPITPGSFSGNSAEWIMGRSTMSDGSPSDLTDYWYAVMTGAYAGTTDGHYVTYQGQGDIGIDISYQITMYSYNGDDNILSAVYPIDSTTMKFVWSNYH